jgi:hypothetical protein
MRNVTTTSNFLPPFSLPNNTDSIRNPNLEEKNGTNNSNKHSNSSTSPASSALKLRRRITRRHSRLSSTSRHRRARTSRDIGSSNADGSGVGSGRGSWDGDLGQSEMDGAGDLIFHGLLGVLGGDWDGWISSSGGGRSGIGRLRYGRVLLSSGRRGGLGSFRDCWVLGSCGGRSGRHSWVFPCLGRCRNGWVFWCLGRRFRNS